LTSADRALNYSTKNVSIIDLTKNLAIIIEVYLSISCQTASSTRKKIVPKKRKKRVYLNLKRAVRSFV